MSTRPVDNRYMEFRLGTQLYALPLLSVKEVIKKPEITTVPNMPSHFEGMVNLRGQILGVYNVRKKIGGKVDGKPVPDEVVIVVEQDGVSTGMTVDEVTRVLYAGADMISPAPLKEDDPAHRYIVSVIKVNKDLVQTVDVTQLLELNQRKNTAAAA